jgi:hypothetical protein
MCLPPRIWLVFGRSPYLTSGAQVCDHHLWAGPRGSGREEASAETLDQPHPEPAPAGGVHQPLEQHRPGSEGRDPGEGQPDPPSGA